MVNCYICNTSELGNFGKPQGIETDYLLCEEHYKQWSKVYKKFRSTYRLENYNHPYRDENLVEGETYPAGCYLCGTLKNYSESKPYSQYYKCPDCLRMVKRFCDSWMRENRISSVQKKHTDVPLLEPTPIGDPSCEYCKKCKCYNVCFSGMEGFPKTSSNFGRSQAYCASHQDGCGIVHYAHQTQLSEFYGHSANQSDLQLDTSNKMEVN